jgi:hypothetical protein
MCQASTSKIYLQARGGHLETGLAAVGSREA